MYSKKNQMIITVEPKTVEEILALPNHSTAKSHAEATVKASNYLSSGGAITSKKLFMEGSKLVYIFYRLNNKDEKFYIIF